MEKKHYSYKNIWKIAYPIILGSLAQDTITIADTVFVGRLGEISLGSIAIGGVFYLTIVMLAFGFGVGVQVFISRRYGEKNYEAIKQLWFNSMAMLLGFAVLFFILLKIFTPYILSQTIENPLVQDEALRFLNIRYFGLFAAFLNVGFRSFVIGIARTKVISYVTIIMSVVNILFDYLLIFGIGFFPAYGIEGAAIASVIAEYLALFIFIRVTFTRKEFKPFRFSGKQSILFDDIKKIFKISTPTMVQNFISFMAWFLFFVFVENMGSQALAVSNIARSIYIILLLPIMGFASATNSLVSYSIGVKQSKKSFVIIRKAIFLCCLCIAFLNLLLLLFSKQTVAFFAPNDVVLQTATVPVLYVISAASFVLAFGLIMFNAVMGTGHTISAMIVETSVTIAYLIGIKIMVAYNLTIAQVWLIEFLYGAGLGIVSLIWLRTVTWKNKKI